MVFICHSCILVLGEYINIELPLTDKPNQQETHKVQNGDAVNLDEWDSIG